MLLDGVAFGLLGFIAITLMANWSALPESLPIRLDLFGESEVMGERSLLLLIPFFALCALVALSVARRIPHRFNYIITISDENAERQYRNALQMMAWIKVEIAGIFAYVQWHIIQIGLGRAQELGSAFIPGMLVVVFGTLGIFQVRSYRMR